ncbi:MAG: asparagine synthase (glutamine-hydrolyzing) [Bacteroidota bacterium]
MCGINGIFTGACSPEDLNRVMQMNDKLSHRGPNGQGTWQHGEVTLGHARLSIIDLSDAGGQPMTAHNNRYGLVFNGEIYNYRELKKIILADFPETKFLSETDSEVLLYACIYYKEKALSMLNGMFAFAFYDAECHELFVARDRMGIKPFYYFVNHNCFVFSSEIRALLASGIPERKLNTTALSDYFRYNTVHAPKTLISNVYMLMPGHYMKIKHKQALLPECYWNAGKIFTKTERVSREEVLYNVQHLFGEAVQRRLVSDVPFGAFLSGGIDSSAVVAMMSQYSEKPVSTFSVTFEEEQFSEAKYARMVAEKYGTKHHEIRLTPADFLRELPYAMQATDHPSNDGPNTFVVSKATRMAGITMALSGLGGDELFAGYPVFNHALNFSKLSWLGNIPHMFRKSMADLMTISGKKTSLLKLAELLRQKEINFPSFYAGSRKLFSEDYLQTLTKNLFPSANAVEEIARQAATCFPDNKHLLSRVSYAEMYSYMQHVLLRDTDQMSMAVALEVRVPFLDYTLVEYVLGLEDSYKMPSTPKKLLVDALGDKLPPEIVHRPKMGFTLPWKHWLKNELHDFASAQIHALGKMEFVHAPELDSLFKDFLDDRPHATWSRIWHLVSLNHWLETNQISV